MRASEWVVVDYFVYMLIVTGLRPAWHQRSRAIAVCLAAIALVVTAARLPYTPTILRDYLPAIYLVVGYWLSGMYFVEPMKRVEQWLERLDRRVLDDTGITALTARAPQVVLEVLELAYVGCVAFVPAGMIVLSIVGRADRADRFWSLVLLGEFATFGMLPWIQTRPPRSIEAGGVFDVRPLAFRRINRLMVQHTHIGANTFPSGHVVGSLATAIAVAEVLPGIGALFLTIAAVITIAAVLGRYHYATDAIAGIGVTLVGWAVVWYLGIS